jgi:hypothetical protein
MSRTAESRSARHKRRAWNRPGSDALPPTEPNEKVSTSQRPDDIVQFAVDLDREVRMTFMPNLWGQIS